MSKKIHSVVACCENGGIGYQNSLPWKLKKEMAHFQKLTRGNPGGNRKNALIMGRKTWDSLPKALAGRYNFVLSRNIKEKTKGMDGLYSSIDDFMKDMESPVWNDKVEDIFCIGGAEIYKLVMQSAYCGKLFCTRVLSSYKCDVFMPDMSGFQVIDSPSDIPQGEQVEENGTKWMVQVLVKTS